MIHSTINPKQIAKTDIQMKYLFDTVNDSLFEEGLNIYDETLYEELTYLDCLDVEEIPNTLSEKHVSFLKELLSREEIIDILKKAEKDTVKEIIKVFE